MNGKITVVCRETDKARAKRPVIYIVTRNATNSDVAALSLRSRYNPELEYYATTVEGDDATVIKVAKATRLSRKLFEKL